MKTGDGPGGLAAIEEPIFLIILQYGNKESARYGSRTRDKSAHLARSFPCGLPALFLLLQAQMPYHPSKSDADDSNVHET